MDCSTYCKKAAGTLLAILSSALPALAQPGLEEFNSVSSDLGSYFFSLSDLVLVIGAIAGIVGGLRVFANWQMGKHHIDAQVMAWFFSCLFLLLVSTFLSGLFGI